AIKILQRLGGQPPQGFDRGKPLLHALREAEGIVPLLNPGTSPLGPYPLMPFVTGGTPPSPPPPRGPLSEAPVSVAATIARPLGRAHERGIVHRDLKPENVIFDARDRPLVLDLGLAKHYRKDEVDWSISLSKTGTSLGTISYMSPEQAGDAKNVGPQADV